MSAKPPATKSARGKTPARNAAVQTPQRGRVPREKDLKPVAAKPRKEKKHAQVNLPPLPPEPTESEGGGPNLLSDAKFLALLEDVPEWARDPLLRSRLTGKAVELKTSTILGRRTLRDQLSGDLDARWRAAVAQLEEGEATPAKILFAIAMTDGMPYREVKDIMKELLPYFHPKLQPKGNGGELPAEDAADLIRKHLAATYAEE
jgi:hypothetical protein